MELNRAGHIDNCFGYHFPHFRYILDKLEWLGFTGSLIAESMLEFVEWVLVAGMGHQSATHNVLLEFVNGTVKAVLCRIILKVFLVDWCNIYMPPVGGDIAFIEQLAEQSGKDDQHISSGALSGLRLILSGLHALLGLS